MQCYWHFCSTLAKIRVTMKEITGEELKKIQVEILDDVVMFCQRHELRYFLAYGTLLGAVRHNGYIPWDDDIDIHMPRPDYEKFIELYNKEQDCNRVVSPEIDKRYRTAFAKVYRKGTVVREFHFKPDVFGVYIDIFPLDGLKDRKQAKRCGEIRRYMHVKNSVFTSGMTLLRKLRLAVTKTILLPFSINALQRRIKSIATECNYNECEYVYSSYSRLAAKEQFPREMFDNYRMVVFEGKEYRAPQDYDLYLHTLYGDYMKLPPEDKRVSTHNSQAYHIE